MSFGADAVLKHTISPICAICTTYELPHPKSQAKLASVSLQPSNGASNGSL